MIPPEVIEIRHELCNCEGVNHADPCAACPSGHFGRYEQTGCDEPQPTGLGDIVASVSQPIANFLDSWFGTNIAECGGCKQRQDKLNKQFSFSKSS